jgi:putative redox protein
MIMKAVATWGGGFQTELEDARGHSVIVDLPRDEGGADVGPSALELNVLSLAGCITTIFALVARKRRLKLDSMDLELTAERPEGAPTITSVRGVFRVVTSAPAAEVDTTLQITLRTCPVGVLYERAGIPVRVRSVVVSPEPVAAHGPL